MLAQVSQVPQPSQADNHSMMVLLEVWASDDAQVHLPNSRAPQWLRAACCLVQSRLPHDLTFKASITASAEACVRASESHSLKEKDTIDNVDQHLDCYRIAKPTNCSAMHI